MGMIGQCPHCGRVFEQDTHIVPDHAYPETPVGGRLCPGSGHNPRNPLSDKRPFWKDMTPEKEEVMQFGARGEKKAEQSNDSPKKLPQGGSGTAPANLHNELIQTRAENKRLLQLMEQAGERLSAIAGELSQFAAWLMSGAKR